MWSRYDIKIVLSNGWYVDDDFACLRDVLFGGDKSIVGDIAGREKRIAIEALFAGGGLCDLCKLSIFSRTHIEEEMMLSLSLFYKDGATPPLDDDDFASDLRDRYEIFLVSLLQVPKERARDLICSLYRTCEKAPLRKGRVFSDYTSRDIALAALNPLTPYGGYCEQCLVPEDVWYDRVLATVLLSLDSACDTISSSASDDSPRTDYDFYISLYTPWSAACDLLGGALRLQAISRYTRDPHGLAEHYDAVERSMGSCIELAESLKDEHISCVSFAHNTHGMDVRITAAVPVKLLGLIDDGSYDMYILHRFIAHVRKFIEAHFKSDACTSSNPYSLKILDSPCFVNAFHYDSDIITHRRASADVRDMDDIDIALYDTFWHRQPLGVYVPPVADDIAAKNDAYVAAMYKYCNKRQFCDIIDGYKP